MAGENLGACKEYVYNDMLCDKFIIGTFTTLFLPHISNRYPLHNSKNPQGTG